MPELCIPTLNTPKTCSSICDAKLKYGRIDSVRFRNGFAPFNDFSDTAEWDTRLSDTLDDDGTNKYIRTMYGVGEMPEASNEKSTYSLGRVYYSEKAHTVKFAVDNICKAHLDLLHHIEQYPATQFYLWFTTGDTLHGGNDGIRASIDAKKVISPNRKELVKINFTFDWEGFTPETTALPLSLKI